jgi:hypothetical protein
MNGWMVVNINLTTWIFSKCRIDNPVLLILQDCTLKFINCLVRFLTPFKTLRLCSGEWDMSDFEFGKFREKPIVGYFNIFNVLMERRWKLSEQHVFEIDTYMDASRRGGGELGVCSLP